VFVYTIVFAETNDYLESVLLSPLVWRVYGHKFAMTLFECK